MIYWLPPAVSLMIYLVVGWQIAVHEIPVAWTRAREEWYSEDLQRESVCWQTIRVFFLWPVIFTVRRIRRRFDQAIDAGDPVALAAKVAERDQRIAQLERDLGIKDRP